MKTEFDKEIDALLRRDARAAGRDAHARREVGSAAHPDADELSAFAEGALPAPARLAAASHLADCDACRGVVVNISLASGAAAELEREAAPASVGRETRDAGGWLAALFSPRVLRFVAPVLALCLVGALALVLLRQSREGDSVAQRVEEPAARRPAVTGAEAPGANADASANMNAGAGTTAEAPAEVGPALKDDEQTPPPAAKGRTEPSADAPEAPDGSGGAPVGGARQPADAAAAPEAAPPPPAPAEAVTVAPTTSAPRDAARERRDDARRAAEDEAARIEEAPQQERRAAQAAGNLDLQQAPDGARNRSANAGLGATARPASPRREPETNKAQRRARSQAGPADETRTAAGHTFRREGGAWVDVNYRPSMPMTGVRRGTEGFRALVADIPELGRVAEQLSGEVITVIRGRAYRIR